MTLKPPPLTVAPEPFSQMYNFPVPEKPAPPSSSVCLVVFLDWLMHTTKNPKACRRRIARIKEADNKMKSEKNQAARAKAMEKLYRLTTAGLKPDVARSIMIYATCLNTYPYVTEVPKADGITNLMIEYARFLNKKRRENRNGWKTRRVHVDE